MKNTLSILVITCDKYRDLWENFFKLRDLYWPDCDFKWYLVTEGHPFDYPGVNVIHTGKKLNWTGRLRFAIEKIDSQYIGWFLDDFYISAKIDNGLIHELVAKMSSDNISHINMSDVFHSLIKMPEPHIYYDSHLFRIPSHKKYGISTASAIWNRDYLLDVLGTDDKNAWQFEIDLCKQAMSEEGLKGLILCDDRMPFQVTTTPVVIQGKYYPKAIKLFAKKGVRIDYSQRGLMSTKDVLIYDINSYIRTTLRNYPNISNAIKWLAQKVFRVKFFT